MLRTPLRVLQAVLLLSVIFVHTQGAFAQSTYSLFERTSQRGQGRTDDRLFTGIVGIHYEWGGDSLKTLPDVSTLEVPEAIDAMPDITAGQGLSGSVGLAMTPLTIHQHAFDFQVSAAFKYEVSGIEGGTATFRRMPLEAMFFYRVGLPGTRLDLRTGIGLGFPVYVAYNGHAALADLGRDAQTTQLSWSGQTGWLVEIGMVRGEGSVSLRLGRSDFIVSDSFGASGLVKGSYIGFTFRFFTHGLRSGSTLSTHPEAPPIKASTPPRTKLEDPPETRGAPGETIAEGTLAGRIEAKGPDWIDVQVLSSKKTFRFEPTWIGGAEDEGGHFEDAVIALLAELQVGELVEIHWTVEDELRIRTIKRLDL